MHWRNALSTYASRREEHCTDFTQDVLKQADRAELIDQEEPTKQEFIEYLETGLVERDFREIF